jgi:hypothetical protein
MSAVTAMAALAALATLAFAFAVVGAVHAADRNFGHRSP